MLCAFLHPLQGLSQTRVQDGVDFTQDPTPAAASSAANRGLAAAAAARRGLTGGPSTTPQRAPTLPRPAAAAAPTAAPGSPAARAAAAANTPRSAHSSASQLDMTVAQAAALPGEDVVPDLLPTRRSSQPSASGAAAAQRQSPALPIWDHQELLAAAVAGGAGPAPPMDRRDSASGLRPRLSVTPPTEAERASVSGVALHLRPGRVSTAGAHAPLPPALQQQLQHRDSGDAEGGFFSASSSAANTPTRRGGARSQSATGAQPVAGSGPGSPSAPDAWARSERTTSAGGGSPSRPSSAGNKVLPSPAPPAARPRSATTAGALPAAPAGGSLPPLPQYRSRFAPDAAAAPAAPGSDAEMRDMEEHVRKLLAGSD